MDGHYWTSTDALGKHSLEIEAYLESPTDLDAAQSHYVGFSINSQTSNEWFWTGLDAHRQQINESFFIHKVSNRAFDFMDRRAQLNNSKPKKYCHQVNLTYDEQGQPTYTKPCPVTWVPSKPPTLKGKHLYWGGRRPYTLNFSKFRSFKLEEQTKSTINFHFHSMHRKGSTKGMPLILS